MQVNPQLPATQVAELLAGFGHGVQEVPQLLTLLFERHCPLQR